MKIKIFTKHIISELEKEVNKFLETTKDVIDIKYQIISNESYSYGSAMIIYEEIEEIKNGK